jgi:hypothetical protein
MVYLLLPCAPLLFLSGHCTGLCRVATLSFVFDALFFVSSEIDCYTVIVIVKWLVKPLFFIGFLRWGYPPIIHFYIRFGITPLYGTPMFSRCRFCWEKPFSMWR